MENKPNKMYLISIVVVAILGGLLFGYDTAVISGAEKGLQAFFLGATDFVYTDALHGFTSSSALIGCIIGSAISGYMASNFGRKKSLIFAGICFFLSALGSYYPEFLFFEYGQPSYDLLVAFNLYRILGGIGVGLASAICPMYIAEVAPSNIRGTLVSWNQFAIIFGQLVVYFVNFLILGEHTNPIIEKTAQGVYSVCWPIVTHGPFLQDGAICSVVKLFLPDCLHCLFVLFLKLHVIWLWLVKMKRLLPYFHVSMVWLKQKKSWRKSRLPLKKRLNVFLHMACWSFSSVLCCQFSNRQ